MSIGCVVLFIHRLNFLVKSLFTLNICNYFGSEEVPPFLRLCVNQAIVELNQCGSLLSGNDGRAVKMNRPDTLNLDPISKS